MIAYLDSIPVTNNTLALLKPAITLRKKNESGQKAFSFTGDLEFFGADYYYLKGKLWDDVNAIQNEVQLKMIDDCCSDLAPFIFVIKPESIQWCENSCKINAAATESSAEQEALLCIQRTLIFDDTPENWSDNVPFSQRQHPRFTYCNEIRPKWHMYFVLYALIFISYLSLLLTPIVLVLGVIVSAINGILNFLNNTLGTSFNTIDFDDNSNTNTFQEFKNWRDKLLANSIGCGRKHPSPLVRDYATNVCSKCKLTFSSSIFNTPGSPYFNACYHNAPIDKGIKVNDTSTFWIDSNKPLKLGDKFFDELAELFNADWQIKNNVLTFERRDFFQSSTPWLDLTQYSETNSSVCWSWQNKPRPAFGNFEYQQDPVNTIGAEANRRFGDIVEWNFPPLPGQKGELKPAFAFAACRFKNDHVRMSDGPDDDVLDFFQNAPIVGPIIRQFNSVMLLNQHTCFTPMLLLWDGRSVSDARVDPNEFIPAGSDPNFAAFANNSKATPPGEYYNYPLWFDEKLPNNMYTNFWFIENPRFTGFQGKSFDAEVEMTCPLLAAIDIDGVVMTSEGPSREIQSVEFNYAKKVLRIKGTV